MIPLVPTAGVDVNTHLVVLAQTLNQVLKGRANNVGAFTLRASQTTTVVEDNLFESTMVPVLIPASATASLACPYISSRDKGSFTLTHDSDAATDRTYLYVRWG